tara:strand:+ start:227 stop:439 length:213 start_codon:yes stop_codon:yes gene_type:complete
LDTLLNYLRISLGGLRATLSKGMQIMILSIMMTGCASTPNGKLYMEYKSGDNHMKLGYNKIYIEKTIVSW